MTVQRSLQFILAMSLFGLAFSGYLTYGELFAPVPAETCTPIGAPGTLLGYPPCVYGFGMYLTIVIASAVGLRAAHRERSSIVPTRRAALGT